MLGNKITLLNGEQGLVISESTGNLIAISNGNLYLLSTNRNEQLIYSFNQSDIPKESVKVESKEMTEEEKEIQRKADYNRKRLLRETNAKRASE